MPDQASASKRKLKVIGWGYEGDDITAAERQTAVKRWHDAFGGLPEPRGPIADNVVELRASRLAVPPPLADFITTERQDRLLHTYGKAYPETVRQFGGDYANAPDLVAYPRNENEIGEIYELAARTKAAIIPFGGGTSVVGGVEPRVGAGFNGTISLDLTRLDRVLEVDKTSRAARIQGGVRVPAMEAQLKGHGLTLRHFPQSMDLATLGGMIATRSGGHFATLFTHIDDFVESLRTITPAGVMESRRLPGSGAGPSPDRLVIGSEGALGIITEAWMRLQDRPIHRGGTAVLFGDVFKAAEAVRAVSQSGLYPSNVRLLDQAEAANNGFGDGRQSVVVLAFESADHPVGPWTDRALAICREYGGTWDDDKAKSGSGHREGAAEAWRTAFIRMPLFQPLAVEHAIIADTFETSITWDRFPAFYKAIMAATEEACRLATGVKGSVSCRFTHVYPDGPAPYFSFKAKGRHDALVEQWRQIKSLALDAVLQNGGTVTHHHAVGRDHMPWYQRQRPALFGAALAAAKRELDPGGLLNPGVIVPHAS